MLQRPLSLGSTILLLVLAGCGGGDGAKKDAAEPGVAPTAIQQMLDDAKRVTISDFPATKGRSLQEVADEFSPGPQLGLATSVFVPGKSQRLGFGLLDDKGSFVYGRSAVYIGRSPDAPALGPFPAHPDSLITQAPYRSRTAASEEDAFAAIYASTVPFRRAGDYSVLAVSKVGGRLLAATGQVAVTKPGQDPVIGPGERAPVVDTDTVASAKGDIESIDTRLPPDDMHDTSLRDVLGKKPVALLFATPQLCESLVCGPVVDIAQQLKAKYGEQVEFIHQEVYVENDPSKGLREPLRRFGLSTEPWLFMIDRSGRVTARLEGSFGFTAVERAIQSGL
jgi:hypothetical protein